MIQLVAHGIRSIMISIQYGSRQARPRAHAQAAASADDIMITRVFGDSTTAATRLTMAYFTAGPRLRGTSRTPRSVARQVCRV